MEYTVIYTKSFNTYLRALLQQGQKRVVSLARAAMTEAGMGGEIKSLARTKHGETRLPNVEKYELTDGHRMVIQLVDGVKKSRAFLFVGSHDEAERWLDNHKDYRWVRRENDGTLEFIRVTHREPVHIPADRMDLESPEAVLALPLLRVLDQTEWSQLALPSAAREIAASISASDYERDADGILDRMTALAGWEKASLIVDLLHHAHNREWSELHRRIDFTKGAAKTIDGSDAADAMVSTRNSESFVTFDDAETHAFFEKATLADWMLFLHPEQKKVAFKDLAGPARLRGVSGSGKTCVLVHRARHLAKKYREPIVLITLTDSLRQLLTKLANELCGVERELISVWTIGAFAKQILHSFHPKSSKFYTVAREEQLLKILEESVESMKSASDFPRTPMASMDSQILLAFARDEISFVRSRLRNSDIEQYLDAKTFHRRGRGTALNETARRVCMESIANYAQRLRAQHILDHEGIVEEALSQMLNQIEQPGINGRYRAVLVDEVQDLSQLEIALLGNLLSPSGKRVARMDDGLFLAGDGAQTIYKRGFTLRSLGIEVSGRSFTLRKNYRNTYEILKASFGLIEQYEFADVDEESIIHPDAPEFAKRHGRKPMLLRCESAQDEGDAVAKQVASLLAMGHVPGQICIIGPSRLTREEAKNSMTRRGINHTELREDVDFESDRVKVSTIESAKGHEFGAVFVMGLVERILPHAETKEEEIHREASRLYVAMTRARENLYLTYSPTRGYTASRFLHAIQENCDEGRYRNGEWMPVGD